MEAAFYPPPRRATVPPAPTFQAAPHPALDALAVLDPDALSPREALEKLYELKRLSSSA